MEFTCSKSRNLIAVIDGDIDHHSAGILREKLEREFIRTNAKNIIFDLSRVSFMDSSGIGMVMGRYKALEKLGGAVAIGGISAEAARIFQISGLHKLIKVFDNAEAADKNLR